MAALFGFHNVSKLFLDLPKSGKYPKCKWIMNICPDDLIILHQNEPRNMGSDSTVVQSHPDFGADDVLIIRFNKNNID